MTLVQKFTPGMIPRVSVVMAVYNGERYVHLAIESILSQSFADFEFLIIDDGSTDGTAAILRSYQDPRIRLLRNEENLGLTRSLNRGLRAARGEYIARQDADDISEPQRLERQVAFLDSRAEVALLGSWCSVIDNEGKYMYARQMPCSPQEVRWELSFLCPLVHSAVMLRRERVLGTVGFYDERYAYSQDYELWCRIADAFPVANLPEYLVRYRRHPASMSETYPTAWHEFEHLRLQWIARPLGWDRTGLDDKERRIAAMTALYRCWPASFDPKALEQAVEDLLKLHHGLFDGASLQSEKGNQQWMALRIRIAANLVMLAVFCSSDQVADRRRLLARAWQLAPQVFLRPRTLARVARALAGAYLPPLRAVPAADA